MMNYTLKRAKCAVVYACVMGVLIVMTFARIGVLMVFECFTSYKKGYHSGFYETGQKCPYSRLHPKGKSWLKGFKSGAKYREKRHGN